MRQILLQSQGRSGEFPLWHGSEGNRLVERKRISRLWPVEPRLAALSRLPIAHHCRTSLYLNHILHTEGFAPPTLGSEDQSFTEKNTPRCRFVAVFIDSAT
jgi:hypothetical protein